MKLNMKNFVKNWAYRSGLLGAFHRLRNRKHLTVVMFHRILPACDSRYAGADPEWTMTPESFAQCLNFFRQHYEIVSPDQVFSALRGETKLPNRSLLITFDDGWADTAEYAQPILEKFSMQALIFVVGAAINRAEPFWEESLYSFLATHPQGFSKLQEALKHQGIQIPAIMPTKVNEKSIKAVVHELGQIDISILEAVISSLKDAGKNQAAMLDTEQLAQLIASRHAIGGHGMTHRPLTKVQDLQEELKNAHKTMSAYLNKNKVDAMSFPHGAYSDAVIAQCRATGYQYLFSSDAHLNVFPRKARVAGPVCRIHLSERAFINSTGEFQPAFLAIWLFLRPFRQLN